MRFLWVCLLLAGPLAAEDVWTLRTGPTLVPSIPLDPIQPVDAWRGEYGDGVDEVWVYLTHSPHFFPPRVPEVMSLTNTPWTAVFVFPRDWKGERAPWTARWTREFYQLFTLPNLRVPVVFPAVLTKE